MLANGAAQVAQTGGLNTADWALILSLCSLVVAISAFVWNVWSKFIYPKPKVRVFFAVSAVSGVRNAHADGISYSSTEEILTLTAWNHGPGPVVIHLAVGHKKRFQPWKEADVVFHPLHNYPQQENHSIGPFSGGLPNRIDVGDRHTAFLQLKNETIADSKIWRVGFTDTFGRYHWAKTRDMKRVKKEVSAALASPGFENPGN